MRACRQGRIQGPGAVGVRFREANDLIQAFLIGAVAVDVTHQRDNCPRFNATILTAGEGERIPGAGVLRHIRRHRDGIRRIQIDDHVVAIRKLRVRPRVARNVNHLQLEAVGGACRRFRQFIAPALAVECQRFPGLSVIQRDLQMFASLQRRAQVTAKGDGTVTGDHVAVRRRCGMAEVIPGRQTMAGIGSHFGCRRQTVHVTAARCHLQRLRIGAADVTGVIHHASLNGVRTIVQRRALHIHSPGCAGYR